MRALLLIGALALGCGGGGGGGDDTGDDVGPVDGGGTGVDAAAPTTPFCAPGCTVAADCATGAAGSILDEDNYRCDGGVCVWRGCLSTEECTTTYQSTGYVCDDAPGVPTPTCWPTCGTAADCAVPQSPILGEDNYTCDGGTCVWTGCNSTAECTEANQSANWRCEARHGAAFATCWPTCTTAADCATASPAYDADNYACNDGVCEYTGCNSTAECMTVDEDWVCEVP